MPELVEASGFVLVGGRSRRMGRDKARLEIAGQPLVLRTVERLQPVVASLALVGAPERYGDFGLPLLADCQAESGPLAGIVTALRASRSDWNLILACDLPYVETRFLAFLLEAAGAAGDAADAVVPQTEEGWPRTQAHPRAEKEARGSQSAWVRGWQPLCAAYHRRALPAFERILAEGTPKISRAFAELRVRAVAPEELGRFAFDPRIFKNMNTPEDYEEAKKILEA